MNKALSLFAILGLLAVALHAQQYSVTSSTLTYPGGPRGTVLTLGDDDLTAPISPGSGFSFNYFGVNYTSFKVGSNGYIIMGSNGQTTSPTPAHGTAPGLVIAPFWADLMPHTGVDAEVRWALTTGNLMVEWYNVIQRVTNPSIGTHKVMMRIVLESATGIIRFQYGEPYGTTVTLGGYTGEDNAVAISGSPIQSPQPIFIGEINGFVNAQGQVTDWPANREVVFTPNTGGGTAPQFTSTPVAHATAGMPYTYTMTATGDPAPTFSAPGSPAWLTVNGNILEGTPPASAGGTQLDVLLHATNSAGQDSQFYTLTIHSFQPQPTSPPSFTSTPVTTATVGVPYSYMLEATGQPDPTFSAANLPSWLTLTGDQLAGTPTALDVGTTGTITLTASNSEGTDDQQFTITVSPAPEAPVITSSAPTSALVGSAYSYQVVASGHPAPTFSAANLPSWLSLNGDLLTGTPQAGDAGTAGPITVTATNSEGSDDQTFSISVSAVPAPPSITSTPPQTATVGQTYTYSVSATGNPNPNISFNNLPGWLAQTGSTISGVPDFSDVGTTGTITVTASNSEGSDDQQFTITVDLPPVSGGGGGSNGGGCVAAPGAAGLWLLALPALLLLRRRRNRE